MSKFHTRFGLTHKVVENNMCIIAASAN